MDWISSILGILKGWFGLQDKKQQRLNDPTVVANRDAARDQKEKEKIQRDIEKGNKTGDLTDERKDLGE